MIEYTRWAALAAAFTLTTSLSAQDQPRRSERPTQSPSPVPPAEPRGTEPGSITARPETPREMKDVVARYAGTWDVKIRSFDSGPSGQATETNRGKVTGSLVLGGHAVRLKAKGEQPGGPDGEFYEGMGLLSYNAVSRRFESIWADNMTTGIEFVSGQYDEAAKTITMRGDGVDPESGNTVRNREVTRWISDREFTVEIFQTTTDGAERKAMSFRYTKISDEAADDRRAEQPQP